MTSRFYLYFVLILFILAILRIEGTLVSLANAGEERKIAIIVSDEGFFPDHISVFTGEEVEFLLTSTSNSPKCFIVKDTPLYLPAKRGQVHSKKHVFKNSGKYSFYCPTGRLRGTLTVLERKSSAEKIVSPNSQKRGLASEWQPRTRPRKLELSVDRLSREEMDRLIRPSAISAPTAVELNKFEKRIDSFSDRRIIPFH